MVYISLSEAKILWDYKNFREFHSTRKPNFSHYYSGPHEFPVPQISCIYLRFNITLSLHLGVGTYLNKVRHVYKAHRSLYYSSWTFSYCFLSGEACNSKASRTRIGIDERRIGKLIVKQTREQQETQVQLDYSSSMACWPPYWLDGSISGTVNKYSQHHSNGQHSNEVRRSGELHWITSDQRDG